MSHIWPYFNCLNFWTAAVEDFWTANSGNIVAAASSSAESPDQSSNTTPVAKLNTFDYQGKIIVEKLSLLLLLKAANSLKIYSIFSCLIHSYFSTWKGYFVFTKSSYFQTGKNFKSSFWRLCCLYCPRFCIPTYFFASFFILLIYLL
jgi:hypothetical protein